MVFARELSSEPPRYLSLSGFDKIRETWSLIRVARFLHANCAYHGFMLLRLKEYLHLKE